MGFEVISAVSSTGIPVAARADGNVVGISTNGTRASLYLSIEWTEDAA